MVEPVIQGSVISDKKESASEPELPEHLKDAKIETTTVRKLSTIIEERLLALKDLATLEIRMPVESRMRERMKTIQKIGHARHLKIDGHWKSTPPHTFITKLAARKINNDEAQITFSVYETDKEGNKKLYENRVEYEQNDGKKATKVLSADYPIAYEVKEIIRRNKAITREIVEVDNNAK